MVQIQDLLLPCPGAGGGWLGVQADSCRDAPLYLATTDN